MTEEERAVFQKALDTWGGDAQILCLLDIRVKTIWSGNIREKITYNTSVITIAKSGAIGFEA